MYSISNPSLAELLPSAQKQPFRDRKLRCNATYLMVNDSRFEMMKLGSFVDDVSFCGAFIAIFVSFMVSFKMPKRGPLTDR